MKYGLKGLMHVLPQLSSESLEKWELEGLDFIYSKKYYDYATMSIKYKQCKQKYFAKIDILKFEYKNENYSVLCYKVYELKGRTPYITVYLIDGKTLTYVHLEKRWSEARIAHFELSEWEYGGQNYDIIYTAPKSYAQLGEINTFFNKKEKLIENLIERLANFQWNQAERQIKAKHDRIKRIIDADFIGLPEPPKDLSDFANRKVLTMPDARIMLYERQKKSIIGRCSYCGKYSILKAAKHGIVDKCPHCKSSVTLLSKGKAANNSRIHQSFQVLQKYNNNLIIRFFQATRIFTNKHTNVSDNLYETNRIVFSLDKLRRKELYTSHCYTYDNFMQTGEMRFCNANNYDGCKYVDTYRIYSKNLSSVIADTPLKYSQLAVLASKEQVFSLYKFITVSMRLPKVELIIKCGLWKFAKGLISNSYEMGTNERVCDVFMKHKPQLANLKYMNLSIAGMLYYFKLIDSKKDVDIKLFKYLDENNHINEYNLDNLLQYVSINKLALYVKQQQLQLHDWVDYIRECKKLGYNLNDTQIITPKHFYDVHRRTSKLVVELENKDKDKKYFAAVKKYLELEYSNKDYSMVLPKKIVDIIMEGKSLEHCVGGYTSRVIDGYTLILFVRKNKEIDKSYYTVELNPTTLEVKQCRGYRNDSHRPGGQADPAALKFVDEWQKKVVAKFKEKTLKQTEKVKAS